jgi:hypothetical protein
MSSKTGGFHIPRLSNQDHCMLNEPRLSMATYEMLKDLQTTIIMSCKLNVNNTILDTEPFI